MCVNDKINKYQYIFLSLPSFLHKRQHAIILLYILLFSLTIPGDFSISKSSEKSWSFFLEFHSTPLQRYTTAYSSSLWLLDIWLFPTFSYFKGCHRNTLVHPGTWRMGSYLCSLFCFSIICDEGTGFTFQFTVCRKWMIM